MINLSRDIQSLSTFKRNTNELMKQIKETGNPLVLTVNGKAELIVQDAVSYQKLLDSIEELKAIIKQKQSLESLENYTIDDFNQETQQAIINTEIGENLTVCQDKDDLYSQLGI